MADMTPDQWRDALDARLDARWAKMRRYQEFFDGQHPMAFATAKYREAFGTLLQTMSDNWCRVVVQSSARRLHVQGFRFGPQADADADAWAIWQANGLDAQAAMVHEEAIKLGEAYWLVEPPAQRGGQPVITCEHPSQMIVATAPGNRRQRVAAYKRWIDDLDDYAYSTVYLPDRVVKYRSSAKVKDNLAKITWQPRPGDPGVDNPLGEVPAIPVCNEPTMLSGGQSDLAPGIPIQLAIDKLAADMMVASEFAAFRQRVMTGVEVPEDPITGQPVKIEFSVNRLFTVEAPDAKVFDLPASDLSNYIGAIEMFIQHLAAQTNTPPHYLLAKMLNISGDALTAAESGLVFKCDAKKQPFGEAHEDMMRLAFKAVGDDSRAAAMDAETIWATSERRSPAQIADAAVKKKDVGVPWEQNMVELGYGPTEIARMRAMQTVDELFGPLGEPAPTNVRVAETTTGGTPSETTPTTAATNGGPPA
jgi:hypothetical protein